MVNGVAQPRLLDLYCCQGGASRGYQMAGFHVTGVDLYEQPRYCGDEFFQKDAIDFLLTYGREFDAIHASPPCQAYSNARKIRGREHPDLVGPTRDALIKVGRPWVIENVPEAPLLDPVILCGTMFGLRTYRHRAFETGGLTIPALPHGEHVSPTAKMGRPVGDGEFMHVVGNFSGVDLAREIMGMPWANRDGLREAIPPVYTLFIGLALKAQVAA